VILVLEAQEYVGANMSPFRVEYEQGNVMRLHRVFPLADEHSFEVLSLQKDEHAQCVLVVCQHCLSMKRNHAQMLESKMRKNLTWSGHKRKCRHVSWNMKVQGAEEKK